MRNRCLVILAFILALSGLGAQHAYWSNYYNCSVIRDFAMDDGYFWCLGTSPFKVDRSSGQVIRLSHADFDLPGNLIRGIDLDSEGNVWMLPWGYGLLKYDGQSWANYSDPTYGDVYGNLVVRASDEVYITRYVSGVICFNGSSFDWVGGGFECRNPRLDNNGELWFWAGHQDNGNYYRSLVHYDGSQFTYTWVAPEYWVENLHAAFDANNLPWAGTHESGLGKWNPSGHWTMYNTQNSGILSNEVKCLEFDASNKLWMGTPAGISTFDGSNWGSLTSANSALGDRVPSKVRVDDDQTVWFGTDNGFVKIANGQLSLLDTSLDGYPYEIASDQIEAPDGGMWFLMGSKVYRFDGATWSPLSLPVQNYQASGICVDVGGILWISGDLGLLRYDGINWTHYSSQNSGLADNVCYSPATDSEQRVWVATDSGLVSFDGSNWQVWNSSNAPFPSSAVRLVKCDPQDRIWVSYYHEEYDPWGGVAVMDEQGWEYLTVPNPSSSYLDPILDIDFWGESVLFTRQGGLARLEDGLWTTYSSGLPGFPGWPTFGSTFDSQGHLWVAGTGLGHFDGNSWQTYTPSNSGLADLRCRNVFVDSTGLIWISNYDRPVLNVFNYPASVANDDPVVPAVTLLKAWPNPFSESLCIECELPRSTASAKLSVYNLRGQKVRGLEAGPGSNGKVSAVWDGRDDKGMACPSGIYLVRLNQAGAPQSLKVLKV